MPVISNGVPVAVLVTARPVKGSLTLAESLNLTRERDAAQEESRRKSDAVAKLSHEMRTPVHLIIGMTEMLADSDLEPPQREIAQRLLDLSQHVGELIVRGEMDQMKDAIEKSLSPGSVSFEQALLKLYTEGKITKDEALRNSDSATNLAWLMNNASRVAFPVICILDSLQVCESRRGKDDRNDGR